MIYGVQQSAQFVLRPLEIKHIYDFAIRLYRARFAPMFLAMALAQLPVSLIWLSITLVLVQFQQEMMTAQGTGQMENMDWLLNYVDQAVWVGVLLLIVSIYSLLIWPLGALTCARLAATTLLGTPDSLREAFAFARRRYWPTQVALATFVLPLLVLSVVILAFVGALAAAGVSAGAAGTALGGVLLILAGMAATALAWFRFFPALAGIVQCAEDPVGQGMFAQGIWYLRRSYALTQGYYMRVLGLTFLLNFAIGLIQRGVSESVQLVYLLVGMFSAGEADSGDLMAQMSTMQSDPVYFGIALSTASIVSLMFPALFVCFQTLLYYDLRCRKEGFDLLQMLRGV